MAFEKCSTMIAARVFLDLYEKAAMYFMISQLHFVMKIKKGITATRINSVFI